MNPLGISLLMAAAMAAFAWLVARKLLLLTYLAPEPRFDAPLARLRTVMVNGFLQRRMIARDWKSGFMHATIFVGFLMLLVRKVQLIVIGFHEPFAFSGLPGGVFAAAKDVVEIALLVALGYAYWRRYVRRLPRLEPNREALLILSLISAIVITDLMFDAFRFARFAASDAGIAHEQAFAFAGRALARWVAPLGAGWLEAGYYASYWIQLVVVFAFLVLLPTGEHFHIVTALPTLYFRRGKPTNSVPGVDLGKMMESEDADAMTIGVASAQDLTWKEGLDLMTCTECGRCKDACPTAQTGKPLSEKLVHDRLKHHLLASRAALRAGETLPPLVGAVIAEETLWACTTCGYCEAACPIELEHLPRFYRMRQHQVLMQGEFPHALKSVFEAYETQSNPWGLPAETRAAWARDLDVPIVTCAEDAKDLDYLFYVGSAESFDPRGQRIARAFVKILRAAGVRFAILGAAETSTGECVRRTGNELLFQQLAQSLIGTLNTLGIKRIVTCDPHAFNTLVNEYPAFGGRYEVVHHTQLIAQLLAEGRLKIAPRQERVVFHDPCYLGRHNGEFTAPRAIVAAVCKGAPLEFPLWGVKSMCCGAGGGQMWMEEKTGTRINVARVEQALSQNPRVIATACPYCAVMMADGAGSLSLTEEIVVKDVAELVADALCQKH